MEWKGGEAYTLADLSKGAKVKVLGLMIGQNGNNVQFTISEGAWERLTEVVEDAIHREDPAMQVQQIINGWCSSCAPTLETWRDEDFERVHQTAVAAGFSEVVSPEELKKDSRKWRENWNRVRHEVTKTRQP